MSKVLLGMLATLFFTAAAAQSYPNKPIRIIVPFPPGNTMDIMSRLIGPKMGGRLGQQIVVENRPGASGMLGLDFVAKSAPDGYTLGAGQGGNLAVLPHTSKQIPYDSLRDFVPIAVSTTNYLGIVANPNALFRTIGEMVAYAKANPGRLTVATNGEGGFPHLAFEHLRTMSGITYTHVPYKGSAAIATDIIGGQVMAGIDGITGMTPHIKSGRLRMLICHKAACIPGPAAFSTNDCDWKHHSPTGNALAPRALRDTGAKEVPILWRVEYFSWWMTSMLHRFHDDTPFHHRLQLAELDYVVTSRAKAVTLAENYVG